MNPHSPIASPSPRRLIRAAAILDAAGTQAAPGVILLEGERILAAGSPAEVGRVADAAVENLSDAIVIPSLVNAHAHLDLTHIGPQPFTGNFTSWVDQVRAGCARSVEDVAASVREGVRLSRAGGTAAIGDIAGVRSTVPTLALRDSGMAGVSFFEIFGVGRTQPAAIEAMRAVADSMAAQSDGQWEGRGGVRFGMQPHAPYSCGSEVYRAAAGMGLLLSTHLAETREEIEFVMQGTGALADMLRRIGVWDDSIAGFGVHPIQHIARLLDGRPLLAAHVNYADDRHLELLARLFDHSRILPARQGAYFGHDGHRYREMIGAGVTVALGTDSIVCLDTADRISVLDEMRLLHRRDATDALTLLRMATINGARALGLRESMFTFAPENGLSAGLLALPIGATASDARQALADALYRDDEPRWVLGPIAGSGDWFA